MGAHFRFLPTGDRLFAGKLAGRGLLDVPGLFSRFRRGRLGHTPAGARRGEGNEMNKGPQK